MKKCLFLLLVSVSLMHVVSFPRPLWAQTPSATPTSVPFTTNRQMKHAQSILARMQSKMNRLDTIWEQIQSRIARMKTAGEDTSFLSAALLNVQTSRQTAKEAIAAVSLSLQQQSPAGTMVVAQLRSANTALKAYRQAITAILRQMQGITDPTATPTSAVTTGSPSPTCTPIPPCMLSGANPQCALPLTLPPGGWLCPVPSRVPLGKIQGLSIVIAGITRPNDGLTLRWDPYASATRYAVYRNRLFNGARPVLQDGGTLVATVTQPSYTDTVARVPDLFTDDSINYFYRVKALNGTTEVAISDIAGEFDYDVSKNKILFISFPYVSLPFTNVQQLTDVVRSQGLTSLHALKWHPPTQMFRSAIWHDGQSPIFSDNFVIEPFDTIVFQTYTRTPDQPGTVVFSGVFPSSAPAFQLTPGINLVPILPSSVYTQGTQLGNALLPQAVKVFNTRDIVDGRNVPFIQYTSGAWTGSDFPLYKGSGYFVEVAGDVSLIQSIPQTTSSKAGDVNGDGVLNAADPSALSLELLDGDGSNPLTCGASSFKGSTGADINRDGTIDAGDTTAMALAVGANTRAAYPGDVNGDSKVDAGDYTALVLEIHDADGTSVFEAGKSDFAGTLGSDVDGNTVVNDQDMNVLKVMIAANTPASLLGDANGDGRVSREDIDAISREIYDGDGASVFEAGKGNFRGAFGADVNQDLQIDAGDITALSLLLGT